MSDVKFCADLHLGHKGVERFRPIFKNTTDHDEKITENVISSVGKNDDLWVLGDVCFNKESFHYFKDIVNSVRRVNVVLGNHDFERKSAPSIDDYLGCGNVNVFGMVKYKGFWLTHCPVHDTELRGRWNVHGHNHDVLVQDFRYINVSMEQINYKPVSLVDIQNIATNRKNIVQRQINNDIVTYLGAIGKSHLSLGTVDDVLSSEELTAADKYILKSILLSDRSDLYKSLAKQYFGEVS